ncbi:MULTISPECIES: hypothetical protein [Methylopila]|uniref:Uncharacterized protein n=2 Tax=Methylopila TaxID=61653 RepID=A0A9W6N7R7_9HYPH|nr:hypothetical protein [Methylopila turkensis]GLK80666.1 hypothetical protein GCM10008174_24070 [Methylopila turkensis]
MPSVYVAPLASTAPIFATAGLSLEEMRDYVRRRRPATTAEALRMLRDAYPAAPLRLRVAACES